MAVYTIINGPMPTTAAPSSVTTGTAIKTMLQVLPVLPASILAWGISFDGSAAATPGKVELLTTGTVAGTVTASANADIMPFDDPNAPANASNSPFSLSTTATGYTCTSEGSITTVSMKDLQLIAPTGEYVYEFSEGKRPGVKANDVLRIRVTFGAAVNAYCWVRIII